MLLRRKDKKTLYILLTAIVALALLTVILFSAISEYRADKRQSEFEEVVSALQKERSELLLEYSNVEREEYSKLGYSAALSLIFKGANKALYDEIFPIFTDENGGCGVLTGIVCLSPSEMPGEEGMMSEAQLAEMIRAGWTAAVLWDGKGDLADYLEQMKYAFEALGLSPFDTVLFWGDSYNTGLDTVLAEAGVKYAVHSRSGVYPLVEQRTENGSVMLPGYVGWNNGAGKGAKYIYEYVIVRGGVSSFVIKFPDVGNDSYKTDITIDYTSERKDGFTRLLHDNLLSDYNKGRLLVGSFEDAFAMREDYLKAKEDAQPRIEAIKADLQARIDEIEKEILNTYYEYDGKAGG